MWVVALVVLVMALVAWLVFKRETNQLKRERQNTPAAHLQKEVAALRKMGGDAAPAPDTPPPAPRQPPPAPDPSVDEDKSTGRRALRLMCREALADKAIDHTEALQLLEAFEAYGNRFPNSSVHIDYIRHELFLAIEDGHIDARESQELVTLLGEFADVGLYRAPEPKPERATRRESAPPPAPVEKRVRKPRAPASSDAPRVLPEGQYLMTYRDASGEISEREIRPKRVERRGEHLYLVSYCLKARAPRTFRVDRILLLIDSDTGEILTL